MCTVEPFPSDELMEWLKFFCNKWASVRLSEFPKIPYTTIHIYHTNNGSHTFIVPLLTKSIRVYRLPFLFRSTINPNYTYAGL